MTLQQTSTYTNPVYRHACPDPYVLKHGGEYWCYFTGLRPDGRAFGILHSADLVHWAPAGSALDPLPGQYPCYWAPEVIYENGRFYMYYSVGDEENTMTIRVAVAEAPAGPFVDSGHALTSEKFAIDAHIFIDDDGARYLFYATDFLDYQRIGTGVVCARLADPFTLAGPAWPAARACYDWQIYDPCRAEKGGVRWHTVEGPFVLKRDGRYYLMFSAGNWHNQSYGVAYAVTDDVAARREWRQMADGEATLPILRSLPEAGVIGPGHNSVVRGPDNCELYCVYHRWQPETEERVLAIDRLGWQDEHLRVYGPTTTPQPAPAAPLSAGFASCVPQTGRWTVEGNAARLTPAEGTGQAALPLPPGDLALELSFTALCAEAVSGALSVSLAAGGQTVLEWALDVARRSVRIRAGEASEQLALPAAFDPRTLHLLRLDLAGGQASVIVDHPSVLRWQGRLAAPAADLRLGVNGECGAEWRGLAVARKTNGPAGG